MDAIAVADAALISGFRIMVAWQPGARVIDTGSALVAVSQPRFPTPYCNALLPYAPLAAEALLAQGYEYLGDRPWFLWARKHAELELAELAERRGFMRFSDIPGMTVVEKLPERSLSQELQLRIGRTHDLCEDLLAVACEAYAEVGLPEHIGAYQFGERARVLAPSTTLAVVYDAGTPIACALSVVDSDGLGGVYWVGTRPAARRRGAADAVTRAVTNAAFDAGARTVTLQASAMGEPVYTRMGYVPAARYVRFVVPALRGRT